MYTAKIQNALGETLTLTGREAAYQITSIRGLNPPGATVNISSIAGMDGGVFNSSKLETRNIVITLRINGDVEQNRLNLYRFFKTKENCTFFFKNGSRDVSIDGYIDTFEVDLFQRGQTAQISIVCPQPYFHALDEIMQNSSNVTPLFTFPFTINAGSPVVISSLDDSALVIISNNSETGTGINVEVDFRAACNSFELKNTTSGEGMKFAYSFENGDTLLINTNSGHKSVRLIRGGVVSPLLSALQIGSAFFQLLPGDNIFEYLIDGAENPSAVNIIFRYRIAYRGV